MPPIRHLLQAIFNHDFSGERDAAGFSPAFFARTLGLRDLKTIFETVRGSHTQIGGKRIEAAIPIKGKSGGAPFVILAQLHGNEPAGLAGILLAMALSEAGLLERDVLGVVGNPLAASQYFAAWEANPDAQQETRDAYRCGVDEQGALLPDMNRIPVDFRTREARTAHDKRAQELYAVGEHCSGILDIHSARGTMVCITDHKRDADLKHSPIRAVLTELADAISANASVAVTVQTLKTILAPLPNILCQTGIEAGRHEDKDAPHIAASFTLSTLHTLGLTKTPPHFAHENGRFERYAVKPRITYADLVMEGSLQPDDRVYMVKAGKHAQYEEMEAIAKGQVVARAEPSGTLFKAPFSFSGIFFSKSAALYDKDPNVGPWPVPVDRLATTKFCYPCEVSEMKLTF